MTCAVRYFSRSGNTKKVADAIAAAIGTTAETTAVLSSTWPQVKKIAEENGVKILEKEYHCKGKFLALHGNRPNEKDLNAAAAFAKDVLSA